MSSAAELTPNANQKIIQYLNDALAMENASERRLQSRVEESIVEDTRIQLQKHLEETRNQQERLKQIITSHGGEPTSVKAELPFLRPNTIDLVRDDLTAQSSTNSSNNQPSLESQSKRSVENIVRETDDVRLAPEKELIQTERDGIIEYAEVVKYKMLMEIARKVGAMDAVPVIELNLQEEEQMASWLINNTSTLLRRVWAQIEVSAGARTIPET
ncbi:MAG: ferritin-like domain-containing protein [Thermoproteota archaeon]|nr:ferritin-like domain-containing protein [Thermoproteota archaeon]MDQ4101083.1 ferritin-like domain-containing protein [Thermoproteota archaeon]